MFVNRSTVKLFADDNEHRLRLRNGRNFDVFRRCIELQPAVFARQRALDAVDSAAGCILKNAADNGLNFRFGKPEMHEVMHAALQHIGVVFFDEARIVEAR